MPLLDYFFYVNSSNSILNVRCRQTLIEASFFSGPIDTKTCILPHTAHQPPWPQEAWGGTARVMAVSDLMLTGAQPALTQDSGVGWVHLVGIPVAIFRQPDIGLRCQLIPCSPSPDPRLTETVPITISRPMRVQGLTIRWIIGAQCSLDSESYGRTCSKARRVINCSTSFQACDVSTSNNGWKQLLVWLQQNHLILTYERD